MNKQWIRMLLLVLALLAASCAPLELLRYQASPTPSPSDTPPPPDTNSAPVGLVAVNLWVEGQTAARPELVQGSEAQVVANFQPVIVHRQYNPDGSLLSTSWESWPSNPVTEMRVCFSAGQPCTPQGPWLPFQNELRFTQKVDWLGDATFLLAAEFREANGTIVQSGGIDQLEAGESAQITLETVARAAAGVTPAAPEVQTVQAITQSAFPLTGSVLIEDGRCCAGGPAGSQVKLNVAFEASSPAGPVSEMRVLTSSGCQRDAAALDAPWEPFTPARTFTSGLALNWVGFYVNVQYRDAQGNLSPVYCDDISLEGSPALTP
jgi:hypothetical protein